jgi:hypothetical protein
MRLCSRLLEPNPDATSALPRPIIGAVLGDLLERALGDEPSILMPSFASSALNLFF